MATLGGIQGAYLEEAVAFLLETSGYQTVPLNPSDPAVRNDPTLHYANGNLYVWGRGDRHQIDAIADSCLPPRFSHPQRLLVEAKFHASRRTGLEVIRNAVGVLKDVSEWWGTPSLKKGITASSTIPRTRYHYQYAVVSSTPFTAPAQRYAFAHDIYLIPVLRSRYFAPVVRAIGELSAPAFRAASINSISTNQQRLRTAIRTSLRRYDSDALSSLQLPAEAEAVTQRYLAACQAISVGIVATTWPGFPILLVANPSFSHRIFSALDAQPDSLKSQPLPITRDPDSGGWLVQIAREDAFSFDMPADVFRLYMNEHAGNADWAGPVIFQALVLDAQGRVDDIQRGTGRILALAMARDEIEKFLSETEAEEGHEIDYEEERHGDICSAPQILDREANQV